MRLIIERIENAGPDRRARRLVFSGLEEPRTTSASVVRALALEVGDTIDSEELEQRLSEIERAQARERALRLLGYRERSVHELRTRLRDDGYPDSAIASVVPRLVETGLVDDERFATQWARSRAAAGFGPDRISRELATKGVEAQTTTNALAEAFADSNPVDRARKIIGGSQPGTRSERDRLIRKLIRRGFDLSTAVKALENPEEPD